MVHGINETTALIIGICTASALLAGTYKVLWYGKRNPYRPGWVKGLLLDLRGLRDAILGRDAVLDSITREVKIPPLPGIGMRMAHQEAMSAEQSKQLAEVTRALTTLVDQGERLNKLESRTSALERAQVERIYTKAESVAAWGAVEAVAKRQEFTDADDEPDL